MALGSKNILTDKWTHCEPLWMKASAKCPQCERGRKLPFPLCLSLWINLLQHIPSCVGVNPTGQISSVSLQPAGNTRDITGCLRPALSTPRSQAPPVPTGTLPALHTGRTDRCITRPGTVWTSSDVIRSTQAIDGAAAERSHDAPPPTTSAS